MLISFDNNMDVNLENQKNRIFSSEFKLSRLLTHWPSSFSVSNDPILNQFWLQTRFVQNRVAQLLETFVTLQSLKSLASTRVKNEFESWDQQEPWMRISRGPWVGIPDILTLVKLLMVNVVTFVVVMHWMRLYRINVNR